VNGTCPLLRRAAWVLAAVCVFGGGGAEALILHPAEEGQAEQVPADERPPDAVVARWSVWASAVAISPTEVITTRHQGAGVGTAVQAGGVWYVVGQYYPHPQADLRIVTLEKDGQPANLTDYVDIYRGTVKEERGQVAVIGGWGLGRGVDLVSDDTVYGYAWGDESSVELRWGQNRIDGYGTGGGDYVSRTVKASFAGVGLGGYVPYEAALADKDSGGGWFLQEDGVWKVAGLSRSVEHRDESWFLNPYNLPRPDPDVIDAVRVSQYADWVDYVLAGPVPGDGNLDGEVGIADLTIIADNYGMVGSGLGWRDGDFNHDGQVGIADLVAVADHYGNETGLMVGPDYPSGAATVPLPATGLLLIAGAGVMTRRRKRRT